LSIIGTGQVGEEPGGGVSDEDVPPLIHPSLPSRGKINLQHISVAI